MAKLSYKSQRSAIKLLAMLNIEILVIKGRDIRIRCSRKNLLNGRLEVNARYGNFFHWNALECVKGV